MYKNTFKMIDGDIVIDKDLIVVEGQEELRQNIENRLSVNKNEWFLNTNLGLKYEDIQGKNISDRMIEFAIRECCFQDNRVASVKFNRIKRDGKNRNVDINITIIDKNGKITELGEVIEVE